jgi:hypothetical protein
MLRKIQLGGREWAIDIGWKSISSSTSIADIVHHAEEESDKPDMFVKRGGQYGYAVSGGNVKAFKNCLSLGAYVDFPFLSFLGLFKFLDVDGNPVWWVFAKINGENFGGYSDTCYETEDEAAKALESFVNLNNLPYEERFIATSIEESEQYLSPYLDVPFLSRFSSEARLIPLEQVKNYKKTLMLRLVGLMAVIGLCYMAFDYGGDILSDLNLTMSAKEKREIIEARRRHIEAHPEELFKQVWQDSARLDDVMSACTSDIFKSPVIIAGWHATDAVCRLKGQRISTARTYRHTGVSSFILPPTAKLDPKNAKALIDTFDNKGDLGLQNKNLTWHSLPPAETVNTIFLQLAQTMRIKAEIKFKAKEKKSEPEAGIFTSPWAVGAWTLDGVPATLIFRDGIVPVLNAIPGNVLESVALEKDGTWKLTGKIYAK